MNTKKNARSQEATSGVETGIIEAAISNDLDTVFHILGSNPEAVNEQNSYGVSPLMAAAGRGHLRTVKVLASSPDVSWHLVDDIGRTALDYAYYHTEILEYLVSVQFGSIDLSRPEVI